MPDLSEHFKLIRKCPDDVARATIAAMEAAATELENDMSVTSPNLSTTEVFIKSNVPVLNGEIIPHVTIREGDDGIDTITLDNRLQWEIKHEDRFTILPMLAHAMAVARRGEPFLAVCNECGSESVQPQEIDAL